jgi:hypothetical protein
LLLKQINQIYRYHIQFEALLSLKPTAVKEKACCIAVTLAVTRNVRYLQNIIVFEPLQNVIDILGFSFILFYCIYQVFKFILKVGVEESIVITPRISCLNLT